MQNSIPVPYFLAMLLASVLLLVFAGSIYRSWRTKNPLDVVLSLMAWWVASMLSVVFGLFLTRTSSEISRLWFAAWSASVLFLCGGYRIVLYGGLRWLRSQGHNFKNLLIIGHGPTSEFVKKTIAKSSWSGLKLRGTLLPDQVDAYFRDHPGEKIDEIWLCQPFSDSEGIMTSIKSLRHCCANIRMVPDWFSLHLINHGVSEVLGISMLDLSVSPVTGLTRLLKTVEDRVLAGLILLLISPLMLAIALGVKLTSPGAVLFKQRRHGWNGEEIIVYKFRSMKEHTEQHGQVTQAIKNDSRITPLGAFLRRTSLDELPQFINVLQGRMSIVGPRPHALAHNEFYKERVASYMLRHKVRPGITGWAQVNGFRGETDTLEKMEKRVEYDLYYIEHMSIWLDLKIIFATLFKGFAHKNAY